MSGTGKSILVYDPIQYDEVKKWLDGSKEKGRYSRFEVVSSLEELENITFGERFDYIFFDGDGDEIYETLEMLCDVEPFEGVAILSDILTFSKRLRDCKCVKAYLKRPYLPAEIIITADIIFNRHGKLPIVYGNFRYDPVRDIVYKNDDPVDADAKKWKLVKLFFSNEGRVIPKSEILSKTGISNDMSLRVALNKLRNDGIDVKNIRGRGYMFERKF